MDNLQSHRYETSGYEMAYLEYMPTSKLYHYCSIDALKGILESKRLWLSDLKKSNDPRETDLGKQEIIKAVKAVKLSDYQGYKGLELSVLAVDLFKILQGQSIYSACFTPHGDQLPMWREYAANGTGVSIGFRPRALTDMYVRIQKVRYIDDKSEDEIANALREFVKPIDHYDLEEMPMESRIEIITSLLAYIYSMKHRTWSYEDEIRLTFAASGQFSSQQIAELPDGTPVLESKPLVRQRGDDTVSYFALPFGKFVGGDYHFEESIGEVCVGANCRSSEREIEKQMRAAGFDNFEVKRSNCVFNVR